jgi:hypothetical protein
MCPGASSNGAAYAYRQATANDPRPIGAPAVVALGWGRAPNEVEGWSTGASAPVRSAGVDLAGDDLAGVDLAGCSGLRRTATRIR